MSGGANITGTIYRAYVNQDGVTHVAVKRENGATDCGPLSISGEQPSDLIGLRVRLSDGVWVLAKGAR